MQINFKRRFRQKRYKKRGWKLEVPKMLIHNPVIVEISFSACNECKYTQLQIVDNKWKLAESTARPIIAFDWFARTIGQCGVAIKWSHTLCSPIFHVYRWGWGNYQHSMLDVVNSCRGPNRGMWVQMLLTLQHSLIKYNVFLD